MLPEYESWNVVREIGKGSYGIVYEIERKDDFGHIYKAALKVISIPKDKQEIDNFRSSGMDNQSISSYYHSFAAEIVKEYDLMSKLKGNSHIVSYEDHLVKQHQDGIGWDIMIRMELLTSLNQYLEEKNGHITRRDIIQLGIHLCEALERCQKFNVIHRDIKPDNIFISTQGDFKLGDFGVARTIERTSSGMTKTGTPSYMAPEVYKGEAYGYSVDIYSLGIVMYRLLNNNRLPYYPPYPKQINYKDQENALVCRMRGDPLPVPCLDDTRLSEIILKACEYKPENRYSSPTMMKKDLEAILYSRTEQEVILNNKDQLPTLPPASKGDNNSGDDATLSLPKGNPPFLGKRDEEDTNTTKLEDVGTTKIENEPGRSIADIFFSKWMIYCCFAVIIVVGVLFIKTKINVDHSTKISDISDDSKDSINENETEKMGARIETSIGDVGYKIEREYDENNNLIKETQYHADGTLGFTYVYAYDENNCKLSENIVRSNGSIWKKVNYEYDKNNTLIKQVNYENDELLNYSTHKWNTDGKEKEYTVYSNEGIVKEVHSFEYNENGTYKETVTAGKGLVLAEDENIDGTYSKIKKIVYCYDVSGKMEKQLDYDETDTLVAYCEIKYDYRFRQTQQSWYYGNGTVEGHIEYSYSEDGSTTEETLYDANGKILLFITNEHAADGRLTITQYDKERSIVAQEVYDEEGNSLSRDEYGANTEED